MAALIINFGSPSYMHLSCSWGLRTYLPTKLLWLIGQEG